MSNLDEQDATSGGIEAVELVVTRKRIILSSVPLIPVMRPLQAEGMSARSPAIGPSSSAPP